MPRKTAASSEKERGSCCSLEAVKHFLQSGTIPEGYSKNDKRALRRRAKSFVLIRDELYFTGGRSRHNKGLIGSEADGVENPENEPDHTQVLRKVVFSEEEQQEIINKAHIGEDGSHHGMEKTTERVSNDYYWMGIIYGVRNTIHTCLICSSRSKNPGRTVTFQTGTISPPSTSQVNIAAAAVLTSNENAEVPDLWNEVVVGENGYVADGVDLNEKNGLKEFDLTESQSSKEELAAMPVDNSTATKEVCSHFWQKVEIQMFGPFQAGRKLVYVVVALDSYSQFPEAVTMEVLSSVTLTNFLLNLFCRYGAMEKLLLLQSPVTRNKELYINTKDLLQAGISPALLCPHVNPLDERWNHIEKSLIRFVSLYPEFWFHCLEAFMVPLRITLPPEAIYSPYYLVHGREAPIPDKLSQLCDVDTSAHAEVQLTEDQEKQTVEMITTAYGIYSDNPSIPVTLPEPSFPKISSHKDSDAEAERPQQEKQQYGSGDTKGKGEGKRRRGRPRLRDRGEVTEVEKETESEATTAEETNMEMEDVPDVPCEGGSGAEDDSDRDATYEPEVKSVGKSSPTAHAQPTRASSRQRKATFKAQAAELFIKRNSSRRSTSNSSTSPRKTIPSSVEEKNQRSVPDQESKSSKTRSRMGVLNMQKKRKAMKLSVGDKLYRSLLPKRKRGRPRKNVNTDVEEPDFTKMKFRKRKLPTGVHTGIIDNMQQLFLDTFYFILKQYLEHGVFPPGISGDAKQSVSRLGIMFYIKEGKLYSNVGKSAGRLIILGEKMRISLLRKAHARGETHYGRTSVLKYLSDLNVFWKGMSLDVDAFIHSCPECICNNPLGNLSVVHIPSKSAILSAEGRTEDEAHFSEDEEEESSYEDLIQYLTDNTFSPTTTQHQQRRIQQRSQSFRIINGSLYYQTQRMTVPRQVLFSETLKHSAIQEAHIENDQHLSQQDTQTRLRRQYFWSGMTFDVFKHVIACCMKESLSVPPVLHRNPVIQDRVDRIRTYYTDGVPELDTSAIAALEVKPSQTEGGSTSVQKGQPAEGDSIAETEAHSSDRFSTKESQSSVGDAATTSRIMDKVVVRAVENVIDEINKSLTAEDRKAETTESNAGNTAGSSAFGNIRSRKDAHKCQFCKKFISGNVAFRIHLYKHTGVKPFTCSTCGKSFTTSKSLQVHTRKHTGIKPYLCSQCGREFFRGTSFKYHLQTHNRTQQKPLPCDKCNRVFLTQNRLDKHKQFKHPAEPKVFMCKHCGKIFMHARSLKTHEQSHTCKYSCHVCKKEFNRSDQLEAHVKAAHSENVKTAQQPPKGPVAIQPQELQQQLLPHILHTAPQAQLVQHIDLSTGNVSDIQWREGDPQQTADHIIITGQPPSHITISDRPGTVMDQVVSHFTISEQTASAIEQVDNRIIISGHGVGEGIISNPATDRITISDHSSQVGISGHRGAHMEEEVMEQISVDQQEVKSEMDTYNTHTPPFSQTTHTPPFSQPTHTTVHILTQAQLPLSTSQPSSSQQPSVSTAASQLESLHTLQQVAGDVLLQQEAVPVQYEVYSNLTEDDFSAVHLLAQASSVSDPNVLH